MDRDDAVAKLKEHEAELKRLGVRQLYIFGSTARGDARQDSDVDLFSIMRKESSGFST
jgi:predicted nucleotidyltransferase